MAKIVMMHPLQLQLREEVLKEPKLMDKLREAKPNGFVEELEMIAAYCDIVVDGYYYEEELLKLCEILINKLRAKNKLIIYH